MLITSEHCKEILTESQTLVNHSVEPFSDHVVGFLGAYYRLTITYRDLNNSNAQVQFFVKSLPSNPVQKEYVSQMGIFHKESLLYKKLLPELLKISHFGPTCYLITPQFIVLEDLSARGFKMFTPIDKVSDFLTLDHITSTVRTLAGYHASTIIFEQQNNFALSHKFQREIQETCYSFQEGHPRQKWCHSVTQCVMDCINELTKDECTNPSDIAQRFHDFVYGKLPKLIKPSKKYRNVLTHDDLWCNNMLFNDQMDCVFVDFQLTRYTPPAFDLLVTLYLNLNQEHLQKEFHNLTRFYFEAFTSELSKRDLESALPKSEFEETLEVYNLVALTEVVMYGTNTMISQDLANLVLRDIDDFNFNRGKYIVKEMRENGRFRERFLIVLLPLVRALETT